jgi:hypothetical protein
MFKLSISRFVILAFFTGMLSYPAFAQQQGGDYEYSREFIWGITKATNSGLIGGGMFKYNRVLKDNIFHGYGLELVNVKHPQEKKEYTGAGNSFILGKENYLYSMRFSYYREAILFRKASQQGVQVNAVGAIGPTLGFEAPYYIEYRSSDGYTIKEPFDPDKHLQGGNINNIVGSGNFLQGVFESAIVPGLNVKAGVAFEFGTFRSNVVGLEVGFQADLFTRQIILMPTADNFSFFPSAYVTLFYGSRK